jgi:DNA polymerase
MEVFSSCLKGMIKAPKGKVLDVGDYNAIEARVLFWLAGDEDGLQAFREGRDLYKEQATDIFKKVIADITDSERFLGKQVVLGCGFQMGGPKFKTHCFNLGADIPLKLATAAVASYRAKFKAVVRYWELVRRASIAAVQNPGKKYTVLERTTWWVHGGFLWCKLPSGRRLAYYHPTVQYDQTPWGEKRPVLYHWGVNSMTKKWERQKTYGGKLVENVVQGTARDVMAAAALRVEAAGPWRIVLTVHDELAAERPMDTLESEADFLALMEQLPDWAEGLPVRVEGYSSKRYRK